MRNGIESGRDIGSRPIYLCECFRKHSQKRYGPLMRTRSRASAHQLPILWIFGLILTSEFPVCLARGKVVARDLCLVSGIRRARCSYEILSRPASPNHPRLCLEQKKFRAHKISNGAESGTLMLSNQTFILKTRTSCPARWIPGKSRSARAGSSFSPERHNDSSPPGHLL